MKPQSPNFANRVYQIVKKIPKGKVLTYKEVAKLAGKPRAWRAVGNILNKNSNLAIPCYRVIRSDGKIGGYNQGIKRKIELLEAEGFKIKNGKIFFIVVLLLKFL
jgi:O-6-methylguanine DNA methyltransferase